MGDGLEVKFIRSNVEYTSFLNIFVDEAHWYACMVVFVVVVVVFVVVVVVVVNQSLIVHAVDNRLVSRWCL